MHNFHTPSYHLQHGGSMKWTAMLAMAIFCLVVLTVCSHAAQPYLVLGGGITKFNPYPSTHDNARFCDQGFQCDEDTTSNAWSAGLGLKFDKPMLGLRWATEVYYADFGTMKLTSQFPPDSEYDVGTHSCIGDCSPGNLFSFKGDWRAKGPVLAILPSYQTRDFNLYGKAGLVVMFIKGHAYAAPPGSTVYSDCGESCKANATRYGPLIGAGISYERFKYIKPFIEFNYVQTFGGGFPGYTSWQSYQGGIRVPFQ